jgi:predicted LPLAT superfamily acyltransferase
VATWKGKTRGGLAGYRIFVAVLRYSGLPAAYFLLRFVAFYFFITNPRSFAIVFRYFRYHMGFGFLKSIAFIYRNYFVFGQVLLDKIAVMAGFHSKFRFTFEGEEYLRKMVADGTGGLLISAHAGNFEMAGYMLERLKTNVSVIMFDAEHEKIKDYLDSLAGKNYRIIVIRDDNSHIHEINNAFRDKHIVCIHGDRFLPGSKTMMANFLGGGALFPSGPFYLAMKFNVPVSFVFAMKENRNSYHFYASLPKFYSQEGLQEKRDIKILSIIREYTGELEKIIRKYPAQWFNYYEFWQKDER